MLSAPLRSMLGNALAGCVCQSRKLNFPSQSSGSSCERASCSFLTSTRLRARQQTRAPWLARHCDLRERHLHDTRQDPGQGSATVRPAALSEAGSLGQGMPRCFDLHAVLQPPQKAVGVW